MFYSIPVIRIILWPAVGIFHIQRYLWYVKLIFWKTNKINLQDYWRKKNYHSIISNHVVCSGNVGCGSGKIYELSNEFFWFCLWFKSVLDIRTSSNLIGIWFLVLRNRICYRQNSENYESFVHKRILLERYVCINWSFFPILFASLS